MCLHGSMCVCESALVRRACDPRCWSPAAVIWKVNWSSARAVHTLSSPPAASLALRSVCFSETGSHLVDLLGTPPEGLAGLEFLVIFCPRLRELRCALPHPTLISFPGFSLGLVFLLWRCTWVGNINLFSSSLATCFPNKVLAVSQKAQRRKSYVSAQSDSRIWGLCYAGGHWSGKEELASTAVNCDPV